MSTLSAANEGDCEELLSTLSWDLSQSLFSSIYQRGNKEHLSKENESLLIAHREAVFDALKALQSLLIHEKNEFILNNMKCFPKPLDEPINHIIQQLLKRKAEYGVQGMPWSSAEIQIQLDEIFLFIEASSGLTEKDLMVNAYQGLLEEFKSVVSPFGGATEAKWMKETATPSYWLLYIANTLKEEQRTEKFLRQILPFSLELLDEYETSYKVMGLKIFTSVLEGTGEQPISRNLLEMLFTQFRANIVYRDLEVVRLLFPLLMTCYKRLEIQVGSEAREKWQISLFLEILSEMERSTNAHFRYIYIRSMAESITKLGIRVAPFLQRLVSSLYIYVQWPSENVKKISAGILIVLCQILWPRMIYHAPKILKGVFLSYEEVVTMRESGEVADELEKVMAMLLHCCTTPAKKKSLLEAAEDIEGCKNSFRYFSSLASSTHPPLPSI